MARNDGTNRISVRNVNLTMNEIANTEKHNERQKSSYTNPDIIPERTELNIHYKRPVGGYQEHFASLANDGIITIRGLKEDAKRFGELIFDVNSAYFEEHGGYEYAKQFYANAYQAAIQIVGGEQYILSAVMHADERNAGISEELDHDVYHYHMHVVYVPVVEKEIRWSKRCKDPALVGTVKARVMQVSSSKKWMSKPALDDLGNPLLQKNGKPVLRKSYSLLQDQFYTYMKEKGYDDVERGQRGSSDEHLTVVEFKSMREQERLDELESKVEKASASLVQIKKQKVNLQKVEQIEAKSLPFSSKVTLERDAYQTLLTAAKKYVVQAKKVNSLQKMLKTAEQTITTLREERAEYKSVKKRMSVFELERENKELKDTLHWFQKVIQKCHLEHLFKVQKTVGVSKERN